MQVDVITNESLGTGSTYGNTDLDGRHVGFWLQQTFGNGMFVRLKLTTWTLIVFQLTSLMITKSNNK